jgi:hypothetical protein
VGPLITGLTPHGLRHGHQTAMRPDRVPRVLRRERLGHGPSGDIADRYAHIDDEMITDMLARQTQRCQAAVAARARIDQARGAEPRSAVPALDGWLAPLRDRTQEHASESRFAPPAPRDASAARPPAASARRHRFADRDSRNRRATSRSLAPASINSAASSRTCSRRAAPPRSVHHHRPTSSPWDTPADASCQPGPAS